MAARSADGLVGTLARVTAVWSVEQVEAVAPAPAAITAAQPLATPARWSNLGADDRVVWGSCRGSGAEPYDTAVDHAAVAYRCTCPSRRVPCKHALALLLLWARGQVPAGVAASAVEAWVDRRASRAAARATSSDDAPTEDPPSPEPIPPPDDDDRDAVRDERVERMMAGLTELDRWLDDRIRTGLADPALARYGTWDSLAARLVDARAGSLANRVRRLAGLVGASPDWHDDVLAELGLLHLLSQAGRRIGSLPSPLADGVATSVGWQVRQADVLGGVPDTDRWVVAGRSDTREDRIEVRRFWLRGELSGRWALVLSFAAYRQSLDTSLEVGTVVPADIHRYPGPALRAIVGASQGAVEPGGRPPSQTVAEACDEVGSMIAAEPWLERVPSSMTAAIAQVNGGWVLTDDTGSVPLLGHGDGLAALLAVSEGRPADLTIEWTPHGVTPLAIHVSDRSIDIGPRADPSFVRAA
jgi:hypothetical protein